MVRSYKIIIIFCTFISLPIHTAILVRGNDTESPYGFTSPISTFAFDPFSGSVYVGLSGSDTDLYALSYSARPSFTGAPRFTGIATDAVLTDQSINLLTLSSGLNISPIALVVRESALNTIVGVSLAKTTNDLIPPSVVNVTTVSNVLNNANGPTPVPAQAILNLTANANTIFAAVKGTTDFGTAGSGSGIALVDVLRGTNNTLELSPINAQTGASGNIAVPLNAVSPVITGGTSQVSFLSGPNANEVAFYYDPELDLLYTGIRIQTGTTTGDIGKAVVVGQLTSAGALSLEEIVPNSALDANNHIIAAIANVDGESEFLSINNISVLHASTGPDYLIVNGGKSDAIINNNLLVGNKIFALPLVNAPGDIAHGTIADKNSQLATAQNVFVTPATDPSQLVLNTDPAALVGAGDVPIEANQTIASMVVVGDTVYVSSSVPNDANNNAGIFSSRAQFDQTGKIIRWTPWTKRSLPLNAFPGISPDDTDLHDGRINQFAIDARTGSLWFVEGGNNLNVGITSWTQSNGDTGLLTALNAALPNGATNILDLDQATRGFVETPENPNLAGYRYALFGNNNKVVFTLISQADNTTNINSPQTVFTDYTLPTHIRETILPQNSGYLQSLEYARQTAAEGAQNYFFAGTTNGLYVFAHNDQTGFSVEELNTLDQPPFSNGSWFPTGITGSVVQIKTSGKKLYVLVQESTPERPLQARVLSIPFAPTISEMFASPTTIAQTSMGAFENSLQFFDMALIATGPDANPEEQEQLVLATSQGLFFSNATNGINTATDQTTSNWSVIANTQNTFFNGIGQDNVQPQQTVWPFAMQDLFGQNTFTRSSIFQLSGNGILLEPPFNTFVPAFFNAQNSALFNSFDHIYSFWSDGARRFFITQSLGDQEACNSCCNNQSLMQLGILPFNAQEWNSNALLNLSYGPLAQMTNFYWVQDVGASGIIMIGTNSGIVGLA